MKVLLIGGTGIISSACGALAAARGFDLYLLNRGQSSKRPLPNPATLLQADMQNRAAVLSVLAGHTFDVIVQFIAYTPEQIERDLDLFRGRVGQYIFISSASAYQTPPASLPVTESTPLDNPVWAYSRHKIACEEQLWQAYRQEKFPVTVVRPSHTYDATLFPWHGGYTVLHRMRQGQKVIVPGDGSSLWTLTHHQDFAKGLVGLLGNSRAVGDAFHITSDEWLSWNQIYQELAAAAGVQPHLVHIPSSLIAAFDREWGDSLLGDKTHSMIFDNQKIKRLVPDFAATIPFAHGAREIVAWHEAHPAWQQIDPAFSRLQDEIIARYEAAWPKR
ncbi:MAG: SDR family oxidoreductase [Anaerolineae bacterium]|nr:SDR family oxidoreductase [Anaerolineae bacterium]